MQEDQTYLTVEDGSALYVRSWMPDQHVKGTICLVHGLGEHSGFYARFAQSMTDAGYGVVAMDLRGHGRSPGRRGYADSYNLLLDDVDRLLLYIFHTHGDHAVFVYGHSMGGALVLNYALRRTPLVAGIVASSPWLRTGSPISPARLKLARMLYGILPWFPVHNGIDPSALCRDEQVVTSIEEDRLAHTRITPRLFIDAIDAGRWAIRHAPELSLPLLLMHGDADTVTDPLASIEFDERVSQPLCTLRMWPGLYHDLHEEPEREQVLATVVDWLNDHQ